jgi:hypothetical protein
VIDLCQDLQFKLHSTAGVLRSRRRFISFKQWPSISFIWNILMSKQDNNTIFVLFSFYFLNMSMAIPISHAFYSFLCIQFYEYILIKKNL